MAEVPPYGGRVPPDSRYRKGNRPKSPVRPASAFLKGAAGAGTSIVAAVVAGLIADSIDAEKLVKDALDEHIGGTGGSGDPLTALLGQLLSGGGSGG